MQRRLLLAASPQASRSSRALPRRARASAWASATSKSHVRSVGVPTREVQPRAVLHRVEHGTTRDVVLRRAHSCSALAATVSRCSCMPRATICVISSSPRRNQHRETRSRRTRRGNRARRGWHPPAPGARRRRRGRPARRERPSRPGGPPRRPRRPAAGREPGRRRHARRRRHPRLAPAVRSSTAAP
jgi:hypothetical protein